MSTTWGRLVGSTGVFAVDLRLMDDPDPSEVVDPDEVASWGSIQLWANGRNLSSHIELSEQLASFHWYLLPLCEWLVTNWDALLHEERLPGPNVRDAAAAIEQLAKQSLLPESREDELDENVRDWWQHHNLAVGAIGSAMPSTFLRRWGDHIEISLSGRARPGLSDHVQYLGHIVERVPVVKVAPVLAEIIQAICHELARRVPASERVAALRRDVDRLSSRERQDARLSLLMGRDDSFSPDKAVDEGVAILQAPVAALLFGSMEPTISEVDIKAVFGLIAEPNDTAFDVSEVLALDARSVAGLEPGPAGSALGEDAWAILADPSTAPVDIEHVMSSLGVRLGTVLLSDKSIRSICVLHEGRAIIAVNPNYRSGEADAVRRFSLAHELCHLILDRSRAVSLAIASGPWAPHGLEQQANAFAAAFLMPQQLVQQALARARDNTPRAQVEAVAQTLNVPFTSAADRLRNLSVLTDAEAVEVKTAVTRPPV